ncbi:Uncharacterized protein Fot_28006 [Forsythia ovata]|uniref:Uncharacterized protein n=1 Tax=Forsythia ovata TaxID=205694 RepID=A0ABD1TMS2_9LAMI
MTITGYSMSKTYDVSDGIGSCEQHVEIVHKQLREQITRYVLSLFICEEVSVSENKRKERGVWFPIPLKRKSPMQRATYEYLRGNILDVFPEYKKDAEDHLSKAKRKSPMQRATYEYLRGNILDVFPQYKKDAEDHLSKAVFLRLRFLFPHQFISLRECSQSGSSSPLAIQCRICLQTAISDISSSPLEINLEALGYRP